MKTAAPKKIDFLFVDIPESASHFFVQNTEPHRTSMFSLGLMTDSLYQFVFELHVYTLVNIVIIVVSDEVVV